MPDLIRIDALPTTNNPSLLHFFAAMKDGLTVQLSVQQIANLANAVLRDGVTGDLDTLFKIAASINNDDDFAGTVAASLAKGVRVDGAQVFSASERIQGLANLRLFAVDAATGTLDWNHSSNTKPGMGETLLLGTAANGPGDTEYYFPLNFVYSSGTAITQIAVPHTPSISPQLWIRGYYTSAWGAWSRLNGNAPGEVSFFARNTAPLGWLKADGSAITRTTFAPLFAAIGTTYGAGNGTTTFNIPDLRGEFIRAWDNGRGLDSGRTFASVQAQAIQSHVHAIGAMAATGGASQSIVRTGAGDSGTFSDTNLTAATGGTNTHPRNFSLLACIRY